MQTNFLFRDMEENRQLTGYYKKLRTPAIPKGKETFVFSVGEIVQSSDISPRRGKGEVLSRYMQEGFCYYEVQNLGVCRTKDLTK